MRYCLFFFLLLISNAGIQRAQISQTYTFKIKPTDCLLKQEGKDIYLQISSVELENFLNSATPQTSLNIQSVRFGDGYTEFKTENKDISTYANSSTSRLNPDLQKIIFDLEKINEKTFKVKHMTKPIDDITQCQVIVQKSLTSLIEGKRDFVINLNNQYYFDKLIATQKFLQCLK